MPLLLTYLFLVIGMLTDPNGLEVGQKAPDFTGIDQFGNEISLYEALKTKKVILTFFRGAWCRYCIGQFKDYQDSLVLFKEKDAIIIAVSPEHEDGITKTAKASKASFSLIHDDGLEIMKAFEVISNEKIIQYQAEFRKTGEDNQHKYLPVPATYIINKDGQIDFVFFEPNYKVRATVNNILAHL